MSLLSSVPIAITGSTGALGGLVARKLAVYGVKQRLIVRDARRAPRVAHMATATISGYGDRAGMRRAMQGLQTLFLVPAGEAENRVELHEAAIDAAVDAGITRIVYVSMLNAAADATFTFGRDHFATEEYIKRSGAAYTFLRDSFYLDVIPGFVSSDGVIAGPAGDGKIAPVAREDIADVAASVLRNGGHDGRTYDMTGPQALTMREIAAELSRATKRTIAYKNETLDEARASRAGFDAPEFAKEGWISTYVAIAKGEFDVVSRDVSAIVGRRPMSLSDFLKLHPESYDHLRPEYRKP
jgi:uncharacterized protein YbjT (DUF2867 family)